MAEYIEREALLGVFDATISHMKDRVGGDGILLASIGLVQNSRDLVASVPTADVVEVVRCKDCKHGRPMNERESQLYVDGCVMCSKIDVNGDENAMLASDFCSYGERKGEGE